MPYIPLPIVKQVCAKPNAAFIFLHGAKENGAKWADFFSQNLGPHIKVICPFSQKIPITVDREENVSAWYDIKWTLPMPSEDAEAMEYSTRQIHNIICMECQRGMPLKRIMIGGYQQGAAQGLHAAMTSYAPLAGILMMSGWLPLANSFPYIAVCSRNIPIFQAHGFYDPVVPLIYGQASAGILSSYFCNHDFRIYHNVHEDLDTLDLLLEFIRRCLPNICKQKTCEKQRCN